MGFIRYILRRVFDAAETALGLIFPAQWNPMLNLGALGFFFYWVITASGPLVLMTGRNMQHILLGM